MPKIVRYILHCLLKGEIADYQRNLVLQIAETFGLRITEVENLATHFTLKYWFEVENVEEIESVIEQFCKAHKKTPVRVGGFGGFRPKAVFVNVSLSDEAKKTFSELITELKKISWITWSQYDAENMHFHTTIAEECNEHYGAVLKFLRGKEQSFDCWFDNITLLRELRRDNNILRWELHRSFNFKE